MPKRGKPKPKDAIVVETYQKLDQFVEAFAAGHLNLLILVGGAGLAKSQSLRQAVGEKACWLEGNTTAFGMYTELYKHRDQLVVIDDVDSLYSSTSGVRLLKCLCQTDPTKRVTWQSAAALLDKQEIPREFTTTSKVAIISNDWQTLNANVAAVQDRGHVILFEPTAEEIHRHASNWFWDQEIFDWFGAHLHLIAEPSLRNYVRAAELKQAGFDWIEMLPLKNISPKTLIVSRLKADTSYPTEEARAKAFEDLGHGCRATYYNHAKKLKGKTKTTNIKLQHNAPPALPKAA